MQKLDTLVLLVLMKKHDNEVGLISYTYEIIFKMYVLKSLKNMILTGCENVEDGMGNEG